MDAAAAQIAAAQALTPGWDAVGEFRNGLEVEDPALLAPVLHDSERAVAAWRATRVEKGGNG